MNINELTSEEKKLVIQSRLNNLQASTERSGTKLDIFQMETGDALLTLCNKGSEEGVSITIDDIAAREIFEFLKKRYEFKKFLSTESEKKLETTTPPKYEHGPFGKQGKPFV
jgi:uncharacterized membrane protein